MARGLAPRSLDPDIWDRLALQNIEIIEDAGQLPLDMMRSVHEIWQGLSGDGLPDYSGFDILDVPTAHWPHIGLIKTHGEKRRFRYEVFGDELTRHMKFSFNQVWLTDAPLSPKFKIAREFVTTLKHEKPILIKRPSIVVVDYLSGLQQYTAPFRLDEDQFAFVCVLVFQSMPGKEDMVRQGK